MCNVRLFFVVQPIVPFASRDPLPCSFRRGQQGRARLPVLWCLQSSAVASPAVFCGVSGVAPCDLNKVVGVLKFPPTHI